MAESYCRSWRVWRSRLRVMGLASATESYAASALYTTLASLSDVVWRIRRARLACVLERARPWLQTVKIWHVRTVVIPRRSITGNFYEPSELPSVPPHRFDFGPSSLLKNLTIAILPACCGVLGSGEVGGIFAHSHHFLVL